MIGKEVPTKWGRPRVIKQIVVDRPGNAAPGAVFQVCFRLARMSPTANRVFLNLPVPFFAGLPGFRSKLWLYDEGAGSFQGHYEWDTVDAARCYARSFAARFMRSRSVPGAAEYSVIANTSGVEVESGVL